MSSRSLSVRRVGLALLFGGLLVPEFARAESNAQDVTLAETLFREAKELMVERRYAEACPKFEESQRLDPAGGTTLNLAVCYEEAGRTANAWATYSDALVYAQREKRADRIAMIEARQRALEAKLSRVTVTITSPSDGLVVKVDDSTLRRPAWNVATPINPGRHRLEASAPGFQTFALDFEIPTHKEDLNVTVPALTPLQSADEPPRGLSVGDEPGSDPGKTARTAGWALGATGVALMGVGGYFGVRALQQKSQSDDACLNDRCSAAGAQLSRDAVTSANVANVTIGVGLVAIGLGAYFFLDGTRRTQDAARRTILLPELSRHSAGLTFQTSL